MSDKKIWFGRPGAFQWMPAPATGMTARNQGYSETLDFENGYADVVRSKATHKVFDFNFPVQDATGAEGLDIYSDYAAGLLGSGETVYWSDAMNYDTNLATVGWSAPGLQELGFKSVAPDATSVIYSATASNSFRQPPRTAQFDLGTVTANSPAGQKMIVPIPPTHTLHVGFSGAITGTGVLRVRPINADGTYAATTNLTALSATASTRLNATFAGSSYAAVEIYLTRTAASAATVTITSLMAQLHLTGISPLLTGNFISGKGTLGLKFSDSAIPETYIMAERHLKGLATTLTEVIQ